MNRKAAYPPGFHQFGSATLGKPIRLKHSTMHMLRALTIDRTVAQNRLDILESYA
jgi:hypothetical protein